MKLTHKACEHAKPKPKSYKLFDGGGLYLEVMPNGSKGWKLKYRYMNKENRLTIGPYPLISIVEARSAREEAKKLLLANIDPSQAKKESKMQAAKGSSDTFQSVALEWYESQKDSWSKTHAANVLHRLNKEILPYIGSINIRKIEVTHLHDVLKKIEKRDALELVRRIRQICGQVFKYAIIMGKHSDNPAIHLQGVLKTRKTKHFAAIDASEIPELIASIDRNDARLYARTRRAVKLSMLTFVRPGELRKAEWKEFNFEKKEWHIPAAKMKSRRDHIIPLSDQAVKILEEQKEETGSINTPLVFPSQINHHAPMSDGTVRVALQKLGFEGRMTAHGFRALARTTIREELEYDPDVIEAQLAHKPSGSLGAAYDRSKFLKQRREMMQKWADYIDEVAISNKNKVVSIKSSK